MTPEQEHDVIGMLEDYKRIGWLWRGIATVAKWIATIAAATAALAATYKFMLRP